MADDFEKHVAGYLKSQRQNIGINNLKEVQDENKKKARSAEEWNLLCEWMKNFCAVTNQKDSQNTFQLKTTSDNIIEVTADVPAHGQRTLRVEFNAETYRITYHIADSRGASQNSGTFTPTVASNEFYFLCGSEVMHTAKMGQVLIKDLLSMAH
jgi:hypothetical protein